jgi:hypothetical protein
MPRVGRMIHASSSPQRWAGIRSARISQKAKIAEFACRPVWRRSIEGEASLNSARIKRTGRAFVDAARGIRHPSAAFALRLRDHTRISSVQTWKLISVLGPQVLLIGTSAASRPRAIRTRPRHIVARIKGTPVAAKIGLEPAAPWHTDIAELASTIACGVFMQRHRATGRWAKSRQTPRRSLNASSAILVAWACA